MSGADGIRVTCEGEFHNGDGSRACATHVPTQLDSATRSLQRWSSGEDFLNLFYKSSVEDFLKHILKFFSFFSHSCEFVFSTYPVRYR